ncbi:MAG: MMPL family transporter [Lachnospiraceae bacterium]|nr:MMPL family transporter [Lachnospiraceae bacterium]
MIKIATVIVDRRNLFFLLFVIAVVFSLISAGWVSVEDSLPAYLPETTETKQGLDLMEKEFITYGTAKVMATNIDFEEADDIARQIRDRNDVAMLDFDSSDKHYNNFSALYSITFIYKEDDERALQALAEIEELLGDHDIYVSTDMGNQTADIIKQEMNVVSVMVAIIVLSVLIFTSQTWAEIPVLIITFLASAAIASGTNFMLGTISFVSDSVTIVLQLALSIDYAVIFCNRYKEEHQTLPVREADIVALSKAIPEISASSLTTIGGLIAMLFMQYGIGPDMGVCLIKAIFFSLLSVFTLMPGLIMLFGPLMDKTRHKNFVPKIPFVGKFAYHTRFIIPPLFAVLVVGAFIAANNCPYVYGYSKLTTPVKNDIQISKDMIKESFGEENFAALIVPFDSYELEKQLITDLEKQSEIDHVVALSNTEAMDGYMLTDRITARQFSELMGVDYEVAELLYTAYAVNDENYAKLINSSSTYAIPLIDVVLFLNQEVEDGYISLDDDMEETLSDASRQMQIAKDQLQGEHYSRMLVYMDLPLEGEETFDFIDRVHDIAGKYYTEKVIMAGESNSEFDLKKTFDRDNTVVSWVSIFAVLAVLLFTFMSVGMPILLIVVIQGAIWLNFSYATITHSYIFFMCYLIVSSIQMGANIDYAIVISGRFMELKDKMSKKDAIIETMNFAFPTIVTSGTMLALAGAAIGMFTSDPTISGIGVCIARGTAISIALVMFVLPQILLLGEKIIDASSFKVSVPIKISHEAGVIRLDGRVQGEVSGYFVGEMHGIIRGEANVFLATGKMTNMGEDSEDARLIEEKANGEDTDVIIDQVIPGQKAGKTVPEETERAGTGINEETEGAGTGIDEESEGNGINEKADAGKESDRSEEASEEADSEE